MLTVDLQEAKKTLFRPMEAVESSAEREVIIALDGKPAARLVPVLAPKRRTCFGLAKWLTDTFEPDPKLNGEVAALFLKFE